ncbi:MAG: tRNA 4-thiouridine(8) synthase ThiI [bacterium]
MRRLAIGLYSGGLDSILAAKLIFDQGIDTILIRFTNPVFEDRRSEMKTLHHILPPEHCRVEEIEMERDFFLMLQSPKYGYGKHANPCLDCKILMVRKAGQILKEHGGAFVFTGEVVGQRPMSQRRDALRIIERESGLERYLLRPLSARLLPPTIAEETGMINREILLDISGRSRKRQMELAERYGLSLYPNPAGGCLLTDAGFSRRFRMALEEKKTTLSKEDLQLLKVGRHFLIRPGVKLVVGRNHLENQKVMALANKNDWICKVIDAPGPVSLAQGNLAPHDFQCAASITARYSDAREHEKVSVGFELKGNSHQHVLTVSPIRDDVLEQYKI